MQPTIMNKWKPIYKYINNTGIQKYNDSALAYSKTSQET